MAGNATRVGEDRNSYKILVGKLYRKILGYVVIILKRILREWNVRVFTGLNRFMIRYFVGFRERGRKPLGSIKDWELLDQQRACEEEFHFTEVLCS